MGGGRSGLFPGTEGADAYQQSLFQEPISTRQRGNTYLPIGGGVAGGSMVGEKPGAKLRVLTVKEVLEKFMDYRYGDISEAQLVQWLQWVLGNKHYYIESRLRRALVKGLAALKATKTASKMYDKVKFLAEIEKIEAEIC